MTRRLVTAISVTHHSSHRWIRRTTVTNARAYPVYRQNPVRYRVSLNQKATAVRSAAAMPGQYFYPMNGGAVPDPLTGLQDAPNIAHNWASFFTAKTFRQRREPAPLKA